MTKEQDMKEHCEALFQLAEAVSPKEDPVSLVSFEIRGRVRYEDDCMKQPNYHDGKPRKTWEQLGKVERYSWSRPLSRL